MCVFCEFENSPGFQKFEQIVMELTEEEREELSQRIVDTISSVYYWHKMKEDRKKQLVLL